MKDNNQSANLAALVDAGVSQLQDRGSLLDMGYVKNITAHYRTLLDELIAREGRRRRWHAERARPSFHARPGQNFNREFTDYFVNGRQDDIGAFDSPRTRARPSAG